MGTQHCGRALNVSFWQNKRILITGADGFLGSNLVKALVAKKATIITLSRSGIKSTSLLSKEGLAQSIYKTEIGSVIDLAMLSEIIKAQRIEIIYHLAALPLVEVGQVSPIKTFATNIQGSWNILEAARVNKVKKIVIVSTSHVYGDNLDLPYEEALYPQPSRPYETSKACADLLAQCYADTYGLKVEIPRFVNLYGPGDLNFSRIVPKIITTILRHEKPEVWDNGAVRDFLYIDDAVRALLMLGERNLENQKRNRIFNFGSGQPIEISSLVKKIVSLAGINGLGVTVKPMPQNRTNEIQKQYVSIAKAKRELGWRPEINLEDGLKATIDWYKRSS